MDLARALYRTFYLAREADGRGDLWLHDVRHSAAF